LVNKFYWFIPAALGVMGTTFIFLLSFFISGWYQFGNRYFFDLIPLTFILILIVYHSLPRWFKWSIFSYGLLVSMVGEVAALFFLKMK
jgi:hypothetical protein